MSRVLSIDLAYKKARDFGICLIEARRGKPVKPAGYCVQGSPPREVNGVIVEGFIVNPCIERSAV